MTDLKKASQWVNWRREEVDGRPTKLPYNPKTGGKAMSNNPATWATYELAEQEASKYDGVGFMFASGICGIDIDGTGEDQERQEAAQDIIALMDSYTEYSPSGSGYHIIFKCDLARIPQLKNKLDPSYYQKNPQNGIECYFSNLTNRYFTYTGEAVNSRNIEDRTEQVLIFLDKYMKKKSPQQLGKAAEDGRRANPSNTIDVPTIARKAKNGNKFTALYEAGDISGYNGDDSSADIALCNILAFYCQGDYEEIDRLFRQSALYREKWEREDYRDVTIGKAISLCGGEFYRGRGRPKKERPATAEDGAPADKMITIDGVASYLKERGIVVRYNVINHTVDIDGLNKRYGLERLADMLPVIAYDDLKKMYKSCPKGDVQDAIGVISDINRYNPVLDMLEAAKWDGRDRLPELFGILGLTDDDRLSKTLVYRWLWQCLSMARNDIQGAYGADGLLCLVGKQGVGKTSLLRKLAVRQEFFYEGQHLNFNDKDTSRRASSSWICELGEVESTLRSDIEKLKAYVTAGSDMYRLPYGRADVHLARRTSLCATANSDQYLIDPTGNRRFWTVPIETIDLDALDQLDALQLWAQVDAKTKHDRQGFRLTREERALLDERNNRHEKPMKAESEIRDIIEQEKMEDGNLTYKLVTVTAFKMAHNSLRNYSAEQISRALQKIGIEAERGYIDGKQQRVRNLPMWHYSENSNDTFTEVYIPERESLFTK